MTPDQSAASARQIANMPPGNCKHRCFDELVNTIARQHGHDEAVNIFEQSISGDHGMTRPTLPQALCIAFVAAAFVAACVTGFQGVLNSW